MLADLLLEWNLRTSAAITRLSRRAGDPEWPALACLQSRASETTCGWRAECIIFTVAVASPGIARIYGSSALKLRGVARSRGYHRELLMHVGSLSDDKVSDSEVRAEVQSGSSQLDPEISWSRWRSSWPIPAGMPPGRGMVRRVPGWCLTRVGRRNLPTLAPSAPPIGVRFVAAATLLEHGTALPKNRRSCAAFSRWKTTGASCSASPQRPRISPGPLLARI